MTLRLQSLIKLFTSASSILILLFSPSLRRVVRTPGLNSYFRFLKVASALRFHANGEAEKVRWVSGAATLAKSWMNLLQKFANPGPAGDSGGRKKLGDEPLP